MFDLGWQEFLLVALVAVIVVGPKDLPRVVRSVSQWIRKARSMAREFQGSLEEMAREADLDDVRKQVQSVTSEGLGKPIERAVDPDGSIRSSVDEARKSADTESIEKDLRESHEAMRSAADPKPAADTKPSADASETEAALAAAEVGAANKTSKIPAAPKAAPKEAAPKAAAPKKAAPKKAAPKAAAAKAPAKKAATPKAAAPKASAPKASAKKPATAKSSDGKG